VYAAVSSSPQEATLEDQLAWGKQVALANGWTITREFSGVSSGAKGTRELLEDLLAELRSTPKAQRPKHVLMIRLDRLGRGTGIESMAAIAELRKLGCAIFTRDLGSVTIENSDDVLRPMIDAITAARENEKRSEKWIAVHARRRAQGLHVGLVPYGVVLVNGKAVPFEPEAAIVREIFRLAEGQWGYTRLARWARENAPPKRLNDGNDKPYSWNASTIKSILESKTLRGLVVTEEQWQATKAARQSDFRARAPKRWPWPLQGAVRCTCGRLLAGHASGEGKYRIRYYICRHHTLETGQISHPAHRADKLEASFVDLLHSITASPDLFITFDEPETSEKWAEIEREACARIADVERRKQKAWALAEEGHIDAGQLSLRLNELDAQRQTAEQRLKTANAAVNRSTHAKEVTQPVAEVLDALADEWGTARVDLQQEAARAIAAMTGLWADPDRRGALFYTPVSSDQETDDSITKKFIQSITE
jgi:DNA invertase Pin-like site-specific DNA recombinase